MDLKFFSRDKPLANVFNRLKTKPQNELNIASCTEYPYPKNTLSYFVLLKL